MLEDLRQFLKNNGPIQVPSMAAAEADIKEIKDKFSLDGLLQESSIQREKVSDNCKASHA